MSKIVICLVFIIFPELVFAQRNIQINITSVPETSTADGIYMAGSFNNWNPKNEQFKFQRNENGTYSLSIQLKEGAYEYKITRGGWDRVECSKEGKPIGNRQLAIDNSDLNTIDISIAAWQDLFAAMPKKSSASKNVRIVATNFHIPQLDRTRRIWAYLPPGYEGSKERYPVLYMHDGQNLFEDTSSFSGEWGVDEFMDTVLSGKCIVIGIDNGGAVRLSEYAPYDFSLKAANSDTRIEAKGDEYIDFIVKTLKPYIDKTYRTKKDKKSTLIAGSSMGGLISMYAVIKYPKVFGGVGVFSPAFWTSPGISDALKKNSKKIKSNIYFYAGKREGDQMVSDMLKAMEILSAKSKSQIKTVIRDEGQHNEPRWRIEFPEGYQWMLLGK